MKHDENARGIPVGKCIVCVSQFHQKEEIEEEVKTAEDRCNEQAAKILDEKRKMKKL